MAVYLSGTVEVPNEECIESYNIWVITNGPEFKVYMSDATKQFIGSAYKRIGFDEYAFGNMEAKNIAALLRMTMGMCKKKMLSSALTKLGAVKRFTSGKAYKSVEFVVDKLDGQLAALEGE